MGVRFNPVKASLALIDDVSQFIPELGRQLSYSRLIALFCSVWLVVDALFLFSFGSAEAVFRNTGILEGGIAAWGIIVMVGLIEVKRFFHAFSLRSDIIETIKADKPPIVPEGKSVLDRFEQYLLDNDGWLSTTIQCRLKAGDEKVGLSRELHLRGASGNTHHFDLGFVPERLKPPGSIDVCSKRTATQPVDAKGQTCAEGDFILLVRTLEHAASGKLTDEIIDTFYQAVTDILDKSEKVFGRRARYARAVVLCDSSQVNDTEETDILDDDIVDAITAHPIMLAKEAGGGPGITQIQIVVDEGEMYTVFPFVPEQPI